MPIFDYLGGTVDPKTDAFHAELRKGNTKHDLRRYSRFFLRRCIDSSFDIVLQA